MISKLKIFTLACLIFGAMGCFKDLNTEPLDPAQLTSNNVYKDPSAYKQVLAKIYAGFAVSGQKGPAGAADISGIDEGFGQYLRGFWYHQELTTDEAIIGWNDQTIKDFHGQNWTSSDVFSYAFYSRIFYQIALANEFLRETTDTKLDGRGVDATLKAEIKRYRAEVRYLRAVSYWHALDIFRNVPFATDENIVGEVPRQTNAAELFAFIEKELTEIDADLADARTNEYGRADKACAWMVLAKLYLNAEVYVNQPKFDKSLEYCDKILAAGYTLEPRYKNLFLADNDKSKEIIFPVNFDGVRTRTYGGMTFIIRAGIGGSMDSENSGVKSGWGGTRTTKEFIAKFPKDFPGIKSGFKASNNNTVFFIRGSHQNNMSNDKESSLGAPNSATPKLFEGFQYFETPGVGLFFSGVPDSTGPKFGDNNLDGILDLGGAKIIVPEAGFHQIKVNTATKKYTIEKQTVGAIGTATNGVDVQFVFEPSTKRMVAFTPLNQGNLKFRFNGDDTKYFGDNGADSLLELSGSEIEIKVAGNYKISLDINRPDYTYELDLQSFSVYDERGMFYTNGQTLEVDNLTIFTQGYAVNKFKNITSTGAQGSDNEYPDTDFPMFRLADVNLMAAECVLRGAAGGDKNKALNYANPVRERAFGGTAGNFSASSLTLETLLDERARELYWECHRRTDLIRFGKYSDGNYVWAWKGGVKAGVAVDKYRNVFPIPSNDIAANPGLKQNEGY